MNRRDTHLVEVRLLATALATGDCPRDLAPLDFNYPDHRTLFTNMLTCRDEIGAMDGETFGDWLQTAVGVDLRDWLRTMQGEASRKPDLMPAYVAKLREINADTELRATLAQMPALDASTPEELKGEAIRALEAVATSAPTHRLRSVAEVMRDVIDGIEARYTAGEIPGVKTGLPKLDDMTGGFQRSDLVILAARPAVGKTALMLNLALNAARAGKRVGILSCEQPTEQIVQRLISLDGRIPAWHLRNPKLMDRYGESDEAWKRLTAAALRLKSMPIVINDDSAPTVDRVLAYVRSMDVDIVFVDYIQRLKALKTVTIYERVSAVALALKELARECAVPVVALAQINRAGAGGNARMENLKGSGDIEQEADVVMILERDSNNETEATLTIDKNRHGPTGVAHLVFNPSLMEFLERETTREEMY